jgi:hypothetical protein
MYGMPFWGPLPQSSSEMTSEDFIKIAKFMEELKAKPKEEKKDDKKNDPDKWGPFDYFMLYATLQTTAAVFITCYVLSHIK